MIRPYSHNYPAITDEILQIAKDTGGIHYPHPNDTTRALCEANGEELGDTVVNAKFKKDVTCPDCKEWLHA